MKVVVFCGGLGMRMRDYSDRLPKPMVPIGVRPVVWHLMRYYAHYGHKDFTLCLGYKGEVIKDYFLNYNEALSNDFVLTEGGERIELLNRDIHDWRITFAETGLASGVAQRLKAVQPYVGDDEMFLVNYSDGVTDMVLPELIDFAKKQGTIATMVTVRPKTTFHTVDTDADGRVTRIGQSAFSGTRINGGYFVFRREIFDYLKDFEDIMEGPFQALAEAGELASYPYDGFWMGMDTFKDRELLDELYTTGRAPWMVWLTERGPQPIE